MDARPPGTYSQARDQKTGSLQKVVATINGSRKPLGAYVYPSRVGTRTKYENGKLFFEGAVHSG